MAGPLEEHKHRYVFRIGAGYLVAGWIVVQVMDVTFSRVGLPEWSETLLLAVVAVGFIPALVFAWAADIRQRRRERTEPSDSAQATAVADHPVLRAGRPSIAVMPFANLSGDPAREYLADGMTDEIVTLLSQLPDIFIIAQNTIISYKGRNADIREIAEDLGVRYILQGSVQLSGHRLRITAQLVDAPRGTQLWADKYEGTEESIFDVQDQVSQEIASILGGEIMRQEIQRIERNNPENLDAWGHYIQAQDHYYRQSEQNLQETAKYAQMAIEADPKFAQAHSLLAVALSVTIVTRASAEPESDTKTCVEALDTALALAPDDPRVLAECANTNSNLAHSDRAIALAEQAVARAPCFAGATSVLGLTYLTLGEVDKAINFIEKSRHCSPRDSQMSMWLYWMSWAYVIKGDLDTALEYAERSIERNRDGFLAWISKTNILGQMGRIEAAKESLDRSKELLPILTMEVANGAARDFFETVELADMIVSGLKRAGLE